MKNRFLYIALCAAGILGGTTSCSDYLDTNSKSTVDNNFVFSSYETAQAALEGAKATMHGAYSSHIFGDGLYYAADIAGSDIMRHPEGYDKQPSRHPVEGLYHNGTEAANYNLTSYMKEGTDGTYGYLFSVVGQCNDIINNIQARDDFESLMSQTQPSKWTQLYGEAVAIRATCYRELIKYFGDVPYQTQTGVIATHLTSRDSIYDVCIADLKKVEPLMYELGKAPDYDASKKNYYSSTYVDGLIGRMALEAGGYQTRRGDIARVDGNGEPLTFETMGTENNGATYGRRSDWRNLYETAKVYFKKAIDHPGTAVFHATDPRAAEGKRQYGNPYQYFFQQLHDADVVYGDESIFEEPFTQGASGNDPRPYSLGRPSNGGSKGAYPCKSYGQGRCNPAFYYGEFDPKDLRRDVCFTVTGSDGKGKEALIPFTPGSKQSAGGISCNKFDENRQKTLYTQNQRRSGINAPYMRISEMYLGYAEALAALGGNDAEAKEYLAKIRNRAFRTAAEANVDGFIAKEGSLLKAIIDERGFEFAGEGDRRFTLIRTGLFPEKIKEIKELTREMLDGLKTNGYYTFENGNTISNYIYTKGVDAKADPNYGFRLTAQCPEDKESDPVLYPSWRGQNDNWESAGLKYGANPKTNLAIKGLFTPISDTEGEELVEEGYQKVDWGKELTKYDDEYYKYLFWDYDYVKAPIYLWPMTPNILSTSHFVNGYGFSNK